MSKLNAVIALTVMVASLAAINMVAMPQLAVFFDIGTMDSMYEIGSTVGSALGDAFGSDIFEFVGIVLFLA